MEAGATSKLKNSSGINRLEGAWPPNSVEDHSSTSAFRSQTRFWRSGSVLSTLA